MLQTSFEATPFVINSAPRILCTFNFSGCTYFTKNNRYIPVPETLPKRILNLKLKNEKRILVNLL